MIYPKELATFIRGCNKYIPRKMKSFERLRLYHRYWLPEFGEFKVRNSTYFYDTEYYFITYEHDQRQAVLSYPIYNIIECYELLRNFNRIEEDSVINNRLKSFSGAEIRFWFTINNVDFSDEENYSGFLPYLKYGTPTSINDTSKYQVKRNKKQNLFEFIQTK